MTKPAIRRLVAIAATLTAFVVCLPLATPRPPQPAWSPDTARMVDDDIPPMFPVPQPYAFSQLGDADFGWYDVTR